MALGAGIGDDSRLSLLRIVCEGWLRSKGIHKFLDSVRDALSGLAKLLDRPVFGMAGGNATDRRAVEQAAGQRGRQQQVALSDGEITVAHSLEPEFRAGRLGYPRVEMLRLPQMAGGAGLRGKDPSAPPGRRAPALRLASVEDGGELGGAHDVAHMGAARARS